MTELSAVVQSFYDNWGAGKISESRSLFTDDAVIVTRPKARLASARTSKWAAPSWPRSR